MSVPPLGQRGSRRAFRLQSWLLVLFCLKLKSLTVQSDKLNVTREGERTASEPRQHLPWDTTLNMQSSTQCSPEVSAETLLRDSSGSSF